MNNCKVSNQYYSFEYLKKIANKLGFDKNVNRSYFLSGNFYDNIFNPVLIFDIKNHEWNTALLNKNDKPNTNIRRVNNRNNAGGD